MRHWYNYPWHITVMRFSSIMFSRSYRERAHSASDSSIWDKILRDRITTSTGRMASMPYTNEYGVTFVEVRTEVQYAHKANGKYLCQSLYVFVIFTKIFFMFFLVASTLPFIWGRKGIEFLCSILNCWQNRMSRGCLMGMPYSWDTRETQLSPSGLTLRIPVMCTTHASFRGMLSCELPTKSLQSLVAWVFILSLSLTHNPYNEISQ